MKVSSLVLELSLTLVCVGFCLRDALVDEVMGTPGPPAEVLILAPAEWEPAPRASGPLEPEVEAELATSTAPELELPRAKDEPTTWADFAPVVTEL